MNLLQENYKLGDFTLDLVVSHKLGEGLSKGMDLDRFELKIKDEKIEMEFKINLDSIMSLEKDIELRDFTINSIFAYKRNFEENFILFYKEPALRHLTEGILDTHIPYPRVFEDKNRYFRAFRMIYKNKSISKNDFKFSDELSHYLKLHTKHILQIKNSKKYKRYSREFLKIIKMKNFGPCIEHLFQFEAFNLFSLGIPYQNDDFFTAYKKSIENYKEFENSIFTKEFLKNLDQNSLGKTEFRIFLIALIVFLPFFKNKQAYFEKIEEFMLVLTKKSKDTIKTLFFFLNTGTGQKGFTVVKPIWESVHGKDSFDQVENNWDRLQKTNPNLSDTFDVGFSTFDENDEKNNTLNLNFNEFGLKILNDDIIKTNRSGQTSFYNILEDGNYTEKGDNETLNKTKTYHESEIDESQLSKTFISETSLTNETHLYNDSYLGKNSISKYNPSAAQRIDQEVSLIISGNSKLGKKNFKCSF